MSELFKEGQKCKWTGPDQRTGRVCEQTVWVDGMGEDGHVYVQDEVGYWIRVPAGELEPLEQDA